MKMRALADLTFNPDTAAVNLDEMLGDGESKACAAGFARTCRIHAIEALEDARLIDFRYANAGVGDGEDHIAIADTGANHDASSGQGVLDGVVEQILQNLGEAPLVTGNVR